MGFLGFLLVNDLNLDAVADDVPALLLDTGNRNSAALEELLRAGSAGRIQRGSVQTGLCTAQIVRDELVTVDLNTADDLTPVFKILAGVLVRRKGLPVQPAGGSGS